MAEFTPITRDEMTQFLTQQGFKPLELEGVRPGNVWGRAFSRGDLKIGVRVYTSLQGDEVRERGEKPISVVVFAKRKDGEVVPVCEKQRVLRVKGWRENLAKRVNNWQDFIGAWCPDCGWPMRERKNARTDEKFWGCMNFPECRGTRPIPKEI